MKLANDHNRFAFLVTNQSGVARGYYDEAAIHRLHAHVQERLRAHGAHLDDIRHCPHHPSGTVPAFSQACDCRKPEPGMLLDLAARWPVDMAASQMIGDNASDMEAARRAGVAGTLFEGGDLRQAVAAMLGELQG